MKEIKSMIIKGIFFFIIGVVYATLFVWCLVQGILNHIAGGEMVLFYYFASWLAGVGAIVLYHQARYLLHYASIIK